MYMYFDLDPGKMTVVQGHDKSLGNGQQLYEILSRSNMAVRNYGRDTDIGYVCTATLRYEYCLSQSEFYRCNPAHKVQEGGYI